MTSSRPSVADKRKTFHKLHEAGCFVIPNPWNVGSARYLQGLGFKALATTSSGHAHSEGYADGAQSQDDVLAHYRELAAATDIPLNADFENAFADDPEGVATNVTRCVATGVAGLSVEDSPKAYAAAGADCLYAPGIKTREQIEAVVKAVAPKPVNFLNSGAYGFTVSDLTAMGVRRISVGGSLARVAMHAFVKVAIEIAKDGKFDGFAGLISNPELNKFFSEDRKKLSL